MVIFYNSMTVSSKCAHFLLVLVHRSIVNMGVYIYIIFYAAFSCELTPQTFPFCQIVSQAVIYLFTY